MNNRPYELSDDVSSVIDDTASQATATSKTIILLSTTTSHSKKIFLIKIGQIYIGGYMKYVQNLRYYMRHFIYVSIYWIGIHVQIQLCLLKH